MNTERQSYIMGSLSLAVHELFRDYGLECILEELPPSSPSTPRELQMASMVGFRGPSVQGGLAFVVPAALLARTLPVPQVTSRASAQLRDWGAEMTNQLLGRFKNKLSARAMDFDVGTAVCFRGVSIKLSLDPNSERSALCFSIATTGVRVYLDCVVREDGPDSVRPSVQSMPEGDVLVF